MPFVHVPLCRQHEQYAQKRTKISYTTVGHGAVLVLMVPGLCVPSSMYDTMAAVLASAAQFTTILIDNRGMGRSDVPSSSFFGGTGYSVRELSADAWAVIDHFRENQSRDKGIEAGSDSEQTYTSEYTESAHGRYYSQVGLIGHSMGGMIIQEMFRQRPAIVKFLALLSTHAGGMWNLFPTFAMMRSISRVALSGFDRDVHAAANLGLHFTQRFLDSWVVANKFQGERREIRKKNRHQGIKCEEGDLDSSADEAETQTSVDDQSPETERHRRVPEAAMAAAIYWEARLAELAHEARIYFGLTASFMDGIASRRICKALARRREVYHARYTGAATVESGETSSSPTSASDSYALYGHGAVVRSHRLGGRTARMLRDCSRVVKLVVTGRHDQVVTPSSSRALAGYVGANTVVEVQAAHFITDEAAAEVTTQILYGLRKAFFAQEVVCECAICKPGAKVREPLAFIWIMSLCLVCVCVGVAVKAGQLMTTT